MNQFNKFGIRLLLATLFCFPALLIAQGLTVNTPQLNFGIAYENAADSLILTINNPTTKDINVTGIKFYNTYGTPAFSVTYSYFLIPAMSSQDLWVKFSPRHNIFHNSEMVITNDGLRGYVSVDLIGQGRYSNSYYDSTENRAEEILKTAIHDLTGVGYVSLGYNIARDNMFMTIDNMRTNGQGAAQNTLECIYTGRQAIGYTSRTDAQTNFSFNTEHTFPQSFFTSLEPMKSDLHHLYPTDNTANNERADNPFAVVTSPTWSVGGSKSDGTHFEPRDEQKGRAARALFYFMLRYQNYNNFIDPAHEAVLRTWYLNFPPNAIEKKRVDDIQLVQHNRNPFVDYPQFIERINSFNQLSVAPELFSYDITQDTIVYGFIPTTTSVDFNYVVVNNGTTAIDISNIQVTHPLELSIISGGSNTLINAGEAQNIVIRYTSATMDSVRAFLSFHLSQTGGVGNYNANIPIFVNDQVFNEVNNLRTNNTAVYPNPAHDKLFIEGNFPSSKFELADITGRIIESRKSFQGETLIFDLSQLSVGTYILKQSTDTKVLYTKLIVY